MDGSSDELRIDVAFVSKELIAYSIMDIMHLSRDSFEQTLID